MLFIKSELLKPGMVLAKDIEYYGNDKTISTLLYKGEILNPVYINRILACNIENVFIESDSIESIHVESYLDKDFENKSLANIENIFTSFKKQGGKIDTKSVKQISDIVKELKKEISCKKGLAHNIIEFKNYDDYTYQHCLNVAILAISTGTSLGLNEHQLYELGVCGMLHDIGKMLVPIEIINKPSKLTVEEFNIVKKHPINAVNQLRNLVSENILQGILSHHEKISGSGYPYGKSGSEIPLYGKILAICDVYDALTSNRSYRKTSFPSEVIEYMMGCVDTFFDYNIFNIFLKSIVAYPIGTFVKLSNGKTGYVVKIHSENIMRPIVRVINDDFSFGSIIDLLSDTNFMNVTITGIGYKYDNISITASNNTFSV